MAIPETTVRTSHVVTIRAGGQTIGMIQQWSPNQSRTVTPVYQLNADSAEGSGNVYENVPGNIGGLTVTIQRVDLFSSRMEEVWGPTFNVDMLTDQKYKLSVFEKWNPLVYSTEQYQYEDFWFTSLGTTLSSTDNRIVNINASAVYARKRKII